MNDGVACSINTVNSQSGKRLKRIKNTVLKTRQVVVIKGSEKDILFNDFHHPTNFHP